MKIAELLKEAADQVFVVAKVSIEFHDDRDDESRATVTLFHQCSADEAEELVSRMKAEHEINVDDSTVDDALTHIANNCSNRSAYGVSYANIESAKISKTQPKDSRKTFSFQPEDLGFGKPKAKKAKGKKSDTIEYKGKSYTVVGKVGGLPDLFLLQPAGTVDPKKRVVVNKRDLT